MDKFELEKRTKKFAVSVIRFVQDLPKNKVTDVLGYQLLKSGTSGVRTIAKPIARNLEQILFIRSVSSKKK
jgi:hypothetical protein